MGASTSKIVETVSKPVGYLCSWNKNKEQCSNTLVPVGTPFIRTRKGSMYFDEDGDLAHEFYEETKTGKNKVSMKRLHKHLTPQGDVKYEQPRLHTDIPVIMAPEESCQMHTNTTIPPKKPRTH